MSRLIFLYTNLFCASSAFHRSLHPHIGTTLHSVPDVSYRVTKYDPFLQQESITDLLHDIEDHKVNNIYFSEDLKKIYTKRPDTTVATDDLYDKYTLTYSNPSLANQYVDTALKANIGTFILKEPTNTFASGFSFVGGALNNFITYSFSLYFIVTIVSMLVNRSGGGGSPGRNGGGMFNNMPNPFIPGDFNKDIKQDKENMQKANITLSDWAGSPEIFEECSEVVTYLRNATVYQNAGAEIPRGILLDGPPGTGKTLLAKAIASECDANFISIASSEFVEVFVGLGAQKVRKLFAQARENTPCILFIDEIDSIGKQRGTGINMGNDEREQTLNQLLAEMDGFNQNENVLIIAATNRKDVLDSALLRPGRFDRVITVPLPDKESRKEIFKVHSRNKELAPGIQYEFLSELSAGFSGAQIKNLVNEAAINAARLGNTVITQQNLEDALEKLVVGIAKKNDTRNHDTKRRVAIHELGHAFLAAYYPEFFDLKKVTIQPTYNGAGGYTLFSEKPEVVEGGLYTKELLKKRLIVAMGGKAAESLYYGDDFVSMGAVQDLKQANQLAQSMIGNYGMGEELQVFYNENTDSGRTPFLGRSLAMGDKYSDKTKQLVDQESLNLVRDAYTAAYDILSRNKYKMDRVCDYLIQSETLSGVDLVRELEDDAVVGSSTFSKEYWLE